MSTLKRKTPAFPKPRKPMRQVSKRRAKLNVEYRKAKAVWRAGHDGRCEMMLTTQSGGELYAVPRPAAKLGHFGPDWFRCSEHSDASPHHMALRGPNLCRVETFCGLCQAHHRWVHEHPNEARRLGYLI